MTRPETDGAAGPIVAAAQGPPGAGAEAGRGAAPGEEFTGRRSLAGARPGAGEVAGAPEARERAGEAAEAGQPDPPREPMGRRRRAGPGVRGVYPALASRPGSQKGGWSRVAGWRLG